MSPNRTTKPSRENRQRQSALSLPVFSRQIYARPDPPVPARVEKVERDGDSPSLGEKQQIFVLTLVDRLTRPLLGFRVVWQRSQEVIQEMVDEGAGDIRG